MLLLLWDLSPACGELPLTPIWQCWMLEMDPGMLGSTLSHLNKAERLGGVGTQALISVVMLGASE